MFKHHYFDSEFSTKELLEVARANPKQALTIWTIDQGE